MTAPDSPPTLLGPAEIRGLAERLDVRPTKQRGQNFVIDPNTVRRIVRDSGVGEKDVVVEIGPGLGSLTLALLAVVERVVAVEIDPVLGEALPDGVERGTAERVPAGAMSSNGASIALPAHCRLRAVINPRTGVGGRQFGIGFELRLPLGGIARRERSSKCVDDTIALRKTTRIRGQR